MIAARRMASGTVVVLALALAGAACDSDEREPGPAGSSAAPASFAPGAAGAGDPYFPTYGNGGYDVAGYDLKVRYDPATDRLAGEATITATATADLSRFNLDLVGLDVDKITVDGAPAQSTREAGELLVTPAQGLAKGKAFTTVVTYGGVPQPITSPELGTGGWLATDDGAIALGEPESASSWFPVNDHPTDKATYTIALTVPDGLEALSNGVPRGTTKGTDGYTTWTYAEGQPMASYLATVVIGQYRLVEGTHKGKPVLAAVTEKVPRGAADAAMARTTEIADFLETQFGPYPFDAYGGIVVQDDRIGYALETQTRPVYTSTFFQGPGPDWVVAHELAHQWFGDSVSVAGWKDIWLNEGFASYAEWLWGEHEGTVTVQRAFDQEYASTNWREPAYDPGKNAIFGRAVYKRGAIAVHALRLTVGDQAFFDILKTWTGEKRNANATTEEFVALAERVSGKDLDGFFDAWLTGTTPPAKP
jgi:aminopeptidase N